MIVAGNIATVGANFLRLTPGAALAALLDNIVTGDRYIFKFARAAAAAVISLAASAAVPAPSASAVVRAVQPGAVSLAASASVPAPSASARVTAFDESWQPWGNTGLYDEFAIYNLDPELTYEVRVRSLPRDKGANPSAWAIGEGTTGIDDGEKVRIFQEAYYLSSGGSVRRPARHRRTDDAQKTNIGYRPPGTQNTIPAQKLT